VGVSPKVKIHPLHHKAFLDISSKYCESKRWGRWKLKLAHLSARGGSSFCVSLDVMDMMKNPLWVMAFAGAWWGLGLELVCLCPNHQVGMAILTQVIQENWEVVL